MSWLSSIFYKDDGYKQFKNDKSKIKPNVYENNITMKQHVKKFHVIHFVFKYKFLVPLIRLGNKLLGKYVIKSKDIPRESHNRNLLIFDKAFEESLKKWCIYYLRNTGHPATRKSRHFWLKVAKNEMLLRSMKNYIITMYMYDTAYREFINILMHEIARDMVNEYSKPPYTGKTGHLFFTTDMYDPHYFVLEKAIRYNTDLSVQEAEKLLQDYYAYHPKVNRRNKNGK